MPEDRAQQDRSEKIPVSQFGFMTRELKGFPDTYRIANQHLSRNVLKVYGYGPLLIHVRALMPEPSGLKDFGAALPTLDRLPERHCDGGILIIPVEWPTFPVVKTYPEYVYRIVLFDGTWANIFEHICPRQHETAQVAEKAAIEMATIRNNPNWGVVSQKISRLIEPNISDHIKSCKICQIIFENALKLAPTS